MWNAPIKYTSFRVTKYLPLLLGAFDYHHFGLALTHRSKVMLIIGSHLFMMLLVGVAIDPAKY